MKTVHFKPQICFQCNFIMHSLFSTIKNKNTTFYLREKVLIFFILKSPFLSEKCIK